MKMIPLLFILYSIQIFRVTNEFNLMKGQNSGNPYYGVPIGAIHYSDGNTRAEAYAASEYTIIFHRFTHHPRQRGCTSMIIGPSRTADRNTVNGGVFLSISQPMVASQPITRRRFTRQVPFTVCGIRNCPVQFDHLELRKDGEETTLSQQRDPFAGIEIDMNSSESVTPKTKDIHIEEISGPEIIDLSAALITNSNAINAAVVTTQDDFSSESMNEITLFDTNTTNIFDGSEISVKTQDDGGQLNPAIDSSIANVNTTSGFQLFFRKKTAEGIEHDTKQGEKIRNEIKDVIKNGDSSEKFGNDIFLYRGNAYPLKQEDSQEKLMAHHKKKAEKSNKFEAEDKGFPIMLDSKNQKQYENSSGPPTVEKRIKGNDKSTTDDYILTNKFFEAEEAVVFVSTQNTEVTMTPLLGESTALYRVIQDPRLKKGKRMGFRKKNKHENNLDHRTVTTVTATEKVHIDRRFELPLVKDKTVAFSVRNGAKITEYQWIALRDHCAQRTIPLLSLKGINPPHEQEIGPVLGQSHNVTSLPVQILNCNTIFIPSFVFNQGDSPSETYFYAGIGHFPDRIEKQVRANVVGLPPDQPLRNYKGENVMIRLPKTYRTFDVDFISVFNEIEERSYGHVVTPSLLVPPCNDYDAV
ncbi:hypothetical protein X798_02215 [Onchocerca flexuosa]|uniref:DM13 domain-containing protein n=1 Tax=Onchocerca flexuosa TaxID=387005 RepID=A0A238BZV3_9BILA|nr:hypothetical protein X798_02215 [Onchocerca flexuosa]